MAVSFEHVGSDHVKPAPNRWHAVMLPGDIRTPEEVVRYEQ